jgi:hypothetical protein
MAECKRRVGGLRWSGDRSEIEAIGIEGGGRRRVILGGILFWEYSAAWKSSARWKLDCFLSVANLSSESDGWTSGGWERQPKTRTIVFCLGSISPKGEKLFKVFCFEGREASER